MILKHKDHIKTLIRLAKDEDLGNGDLTSNAVIPEDCIASAVIISREELVVCGHEIAKLVLEEFDTSIDYHIEISDGTRVEADKILAKLEGPFRSILIAERTLLNFMQHLSGVATKTSYYASLIEGTSAKLLDTRKTTPGFRVLEKYAVKVGGGFNHRFGLYDAVLIKNNHIDCVSGNIERAVTLAREASPSGTKIEIEVRDLKELGKAISCSPDIILLDNMTTVQTKEAVSVARLANSKILLESSGGITDRNIRDYAETGVDYISIGALTHSVKASDISLRFSEKIFAK